MRRAALLTALLAFGLRPAHAATALFSLAVGYNGLPPAMHDAGISALSFADDDALAMHELASTFGRKSIVLTLADRATQGHYPSSHQARPPSMAELRRALAELGADVERAARAGDETIVWFFYSGHGWLDEKGRANLTLADGSLSQSMLHDEVLAGLPGRTVHLMIDACHAEALLRPRDIAAETVEMSASQIASASLRRRLDQLPHVGAIMASASNTQAHEWEDYQTGVFTHELLSGLRGGADVNGDGRVEYSEMTAFLAAVNREVTDPRAQLTTLIAAPKLYPRVPLLDTRAMRAVAHLQGRAHHLGRFRIDDQRGNRLLDLRPEAGFVVDLVVPAGESILISNDAGERTIQTTAHKPVNLEAVVMEPARARHRSATTEALRRGLFAAEFGPSYYGGFVDSAGPKIVPVELAPVGVRVPAAGSAPVGHSAAAWTAFAVTGASAVATGVFAMLAARAYDDNQDAKFERPSAEARDRYERYGTLTIGAAAIGAASAVLGYWLWNRDKASDGRSAHLNEEAGPQ